MTLWRCLFSKPSDITTTNKPTQIKKIWTDSLLEAVFLEQIDDKDYVAVAIETGKKIVKLAINLSTTERCILDWDVDDSLEF